MSTCQGDVPGDRILVHTHQAAGTPRSAPLADMVQHVPGLRVGQAGLLQDGPFALGEVGLAGAAIDHANPLALAAPASEDEVSLTPLASIGAVGILTTKVLDVLPGDPP